MCHRFLRFTSGATPANLLTTSMAAGRISYLHVVDAGVQSWDFLHSKQTRYPLGHRDRFTFEKIVTKHLSNLLVLRHIKFFLKHTKLAMLELLPPLHSVYLRFSSLFDTSKCEIRNLFQGYMLLLDQLIFNGRAKAKLAFLYCGEFLKNYWSLMYPQKGNANLEVCIANR